MLCSCFYLGADGTFRRDAPTAEIAALRAQTDGLLWLDFLDTDEKDGQFLIEEFGFHHLAIEDCVGPRIDPPKADDYGEYLFILVHGINHTQDSDTVETAELSLFVGSNYVVSCHNAPLFSVEAIKGHVAGDGPPLRYGADYLAHALIDSLVDNVLPTLDRMAEIATEVEEQAARSPSPAILQTILRLKRSVRQIHSTMVPQKKVLSQIHRGEFKTFIRHETAPFYGDIHDHLITIEDLNEAIRDAADSALSVYMSSVANRQNETMKLLAIAGAIFLPLTLLSGIYGMNFDNMPELHWWWGYFGVVAVMGTVILVALAVFWRRGWFRFRPPPPPVFKVDRSLLRGHKESED